MPDFLGFLQPVATQPARFASRFLLANRRLKFITDPTPKRGPSNVQSVTEVFRLRQVVNQNFKSKLNLIFEANLIRFFVPVFCSILFMVQKFNLSSCCTSFTFSFYFFAKKEFWKCHWRISLCKLSTSFCYNYNIFSTLSIHTFCKNMKKTISNDH